jgi:RNA polymerase sigma-B factor
VVEGLRSQQVVHTFSLDEPARDEGQSSGDHLRFGAALRQIDVEFDLVEHRESLPPLLARLDERQRRILVLRSCHEMTQTEIAVQVGISQMHVSRPLTRTLAWLRARLAD